LYIEQNVYVPIYEQAVEFHDSNIQKSFKGFVDCYDMITDTVLEFKCTNNIEHKHIIQTIVYRYMADIVIPDTTYTSKTSHIYNMKTNEHIEISASHETIRSIIETILKSRNDETSSFYKSNEQFIQVSLKQ
jgi:hypothetical protein